MQRPHLEADLVQLLTKIDDISRLTQKFLVGRGDPSDLTAINKTIRTWTRVSAMLRAEKLLERNEQRNHNHEEWKSLDALISRMHTLTELSEAIESAISMDAEEVDGGSDEPRSDADSESEDEPIQLLNWKLSTNQWSIRPE